ncbi:MAG: UPF0182 family protein [Acidimicrobiales bacterium]|nr:UPF0182 family protein [Acidimicrobiales bacterium]
MRASYDMPRGRPRSRASRGRVFIVVALVILFVLFTSMRGIATFYTDRLWFQSLPGADGTSNLGSVFDLIVLTKIKLGAVFSAVFFVLMYANLAIADRLAPVFRPAGQDDEFIKRYHDVIDRRSGLVRFAVSALFAVMAGAGVSSQWNEYLLWANGGDFGTSDATFQRDIGFYIFELPFYKVVIDWLFAALVIVLLTTLAAHYINGGIRLQAPHQRMTPGVKAHLSVLCALLAVVRAAGYFLDQFEIVYSSRGIVNGATYAEVNHLLPALRLLVLIALTAAFVFLINIRRRGWVLPMVVVGLWAFVQVVAGAIVPAVVQRFYVKPTESTRERPYIANNIAATREGLNMVPGRTVETRAFAYEGDAEAAKRALEKNPETVRNIPLLDPSQVRDTYQQLQKQQDFYKFNELDVDRYDIRVGDRYESTAVVLGVRDLGGVPKQSWENQHVAYTHGYGLALAAAQGVVGQGDPDFLIRDIPIQHSEVIPPEAHVQQPYVYFGEYPNSPSSYVITGARGREEIGYINKDQETTTNRYDGTGGVKIASSFDQAMFSLRFNDTDLLFSNFIGPDSKILFNRDVGQRVRAVAPFIAWDADPYPVVANGRIQYIVDGYTFSDRYPNAERTSGDEARVSSGSGLRGRSFNYIRNSVKALVDAYDGTVSLYVWDRSDPIIAAYRRAFPNLFRSDDQMHSEVRRHVRYPLDLFSVQTQMWGVYRIDDPESWYQRSGAWSVAQRAPNDPKASTTTTQPQLQGTLPGQSIRIARGDPIEPYYTLLNLPDDERAQFVPLRPFVPVSDSSGSTQLLSGFMVAKSDGAEYGKLIAYEVPPFTINGPAPTSAQVNANTEISEQITLLGSLNSSVTFGHMLLVPVDRSLLWVRGLYVTSTQQKLPELKRVVVVFGDQVVMKPTLDEALRELFGQDLDIQTLERDRVTNDASNEQSSGQSTSTTSTTPTSAPGPAGSAPSTIPSLPPGDASNIPRLLQEANAELDEANRLLREGKLGEYQLHVERAREKLQLAIALLASTSVPTSSTTAVPPSTLPA